MKRLTMTVFAPASVLGVLLLAAPVASAAPITFFGEDLNPGLTVPPGGNANLARLEFLSNLAGGVGTETFEGFALGTGAPLNISFPGSTGNITATLAGPGAYGIENNAGGGGTGGAASVGRFNTTPGGSQFLEAAAGQNFTITFSSPIAAFGFFGTDIGDFSGQLTLALTQGGVVNIPIPHTVGGPNGSLLYWGFIDQVNTYTAIAFNTTQSVDRFGFDDMTVGDLGQVVPEPGTLTLVGLGLVGLCLRGRRRT
jgi:hypothetical protein